MYTFCLVSFSASCLPLFRIDGVVFGISVMWCFYLMLFSVLFISVAFDVFSLIASFFLVCFFLQLLFFFVSEGSREVRMLLTRVCTILIST